MWFQRLSFSSSSSIPPARLRRHVNTVYAPHRFELHQSRFSAQRISIMRTGCHSNWNEFKFQPYSRNVSAAPQSAGKHANRVMIAFPIHPRINSKMQIRAFLSILFYFSLYTCENYGDNTTNWHVTLNALQSSQNAENILHNYEKRFISLRAKQWLYARHSERPVQLARFKCFCSTSHRVTREIAKVAYFSRFCFAAGSRQIWRTSGDLGQHGWRYVHFIRLLFTFCTGATHRFCAR